MLLLLFISAIKLLEVLYMNGQQCLSPGSYTTDTILTNILYSLQTIKSCPLEPVAVQETNPIAKGPLHCHSPTDGK